MCQGGQFAHNDLTTSSARCLKSGMDEKTCPANNIVGKMFILIITCICNIISLTYCLCVFHHRVVVCASQNEPYKIYNGFCHINAVT